MKLKTISLATMTLVMVLALAAPVQAADFGPLNIQVGISVGNKWISYPIFHSVTFTGDPLSTTVQITADKANLYDMVYRTYGTNSFTVTIPGGSGPQVFWEEDFSRIKGPSDKRTLTVQVYVPVECPELKLTIILTPPT